VNLRIDDQPFRRLRDQQLDALRREREAGCDGAGKKSTA
jgi:hypothetical protein